MNPSSTTTPSGSLGVAQIEKKQGHISEEMKILAVITENLNVSFGKLANKLVSISRGEPFDVDKAEKPNLKPVVGLASEIRSWNLRLEDLNKAVIHLTNQIEL